MYILFWICERDPTNQLKYSSKTLQAELKRMISEYQNSITSKDAMDLIQIRYDCCGSEEPMDWVEEREKQLDASPQKTHNSSIFPMSCCIQNVCGSNLDVFLLNNISAGFLSIGSFVKSNGCIEKLRNTMAATWMESSFLFFLFPIIVEMAFVSNSCCCATYISR